MGFEVGVADPMDHHRRIGRDHFAELGGERVLIEAAVRNIEIEPAFAVANRAAGDRMRQDR